MPTGFLRRSLDKERTREFLSEVGSR